MKRSVTGFLEWCHDPDTYGFRFSPRGQATLLSTCFGVQLAYLHDIGDVYDRGRLANTIRTCGQPSGLFRDPEFRVDDLVGSHDATYLDWQFTYFSLIALDMLGAASDQPLAFLAEFKQSSFLAAWLESREWDRFWHASNEIMFLLYFLTWESVHCPSQKGACSESLNQCFAELDRRQDPQTGFWGTESGGDLAQGLFGAAHIYLFYEYHNRPLQYRREAIDTTVKLANQRGLYGGLYGGACEDYDAAEVLLRTAAMGEILPAAAVDVLQRMKQSITDACRRGGFPYALPRPGTLGVVDRVSFKIRGQSLYRYSGWQKMESALFSPDMWGTYFRTLTLAMIERSSNPSSLGVTYDLPGWGYLVAPGCALDKGADE